MLGPVLVGLAAVGLAMGSEYANRLNRFVVHMYFWSPLLFMPTGFALLAYCCKRYFPGSQGSGIPQTMAAMDDAGTAKQTSLLSVRIAVGKIFSTLAGLCIGASIGREGPTVQIGASIMHMFYGRGPFQSAETRRILILAGGAAGIAAAFNTPLAGIMFAIEELSKKHVFNANSSTLVTVIVSGLISLALLGNYTYFGSSGASLDWHSALAAVLLCGTVGGLAGGLFSRLLIAGSFSLPPRMAAFVRERPVLFAAMCGLVVAILGVCTNGLVFGTGYEPTRLTLEGRDTLPWYFGLAKLAATLVSSMSGIVGGIFAPSLAVGAGIGDNLADLFPALATRSAIVMLVMASYLSGVTRAPVTSFIIMMEMTNSHQMLLPLMAASVVASGASKLICPTALYHALAKKFSHVADGVYAVDRTVQKTGERNQEATSSDATGEHAEEKK